MLRSPSRMSSTLQRAVWNGKPEQVGIAWTLKKRNHTVECVVFSHQFGWELRLQSGELFRTQVCRSDREIEDVSAAWKAAMVEKGWR